MKIHSRHNTKNKNVYRIFIAAVMVIGVGMALPSAMSFIGAVIMYPVHVTNQWFLQSQSVFPMFLREQKSLIDQVADLENKLATASATGLSQQRLYEENVWLRGLLGATTSPRIAAAVIARPTTLPYDLLQIDRGQEHGIVAGAPVYIGVDKVIGVVVSTASRYSFVELFTTPGFSATVFVGGANVIATLDGYGSGIARVRVPQGIPLAVGNLVHIPSLEPGVFGRIEFVENLPTQPEQYGYISMAEPISGINYVSVATAPVESSEPLVVEERIRELVRQSFIVPADSMTIIATTSATTTDVSGSTTPESSL
jgi:cell shape-determining protein MreC